MKTRIITALLIILCVVPPLVYGGWLIDLLIAFIIVAGGIELLNLKEQDAKWPLGIKTQIGRASCRERVSSPV